MTEGAKKTESETTSLRFGSVFEWVNPHDPDKEKTLRIVMEPIGKSLESGQILDYGTEKERITNPGGDRVATFSDVSEIERWDVDRILKARINLMKIGGLDETKTKELEIKWRTIFESYTEPQK